MNGMIILIWTSLKYDGCVEFVHISSDDDGDDNDKNNDEDDV